VFKFFQDLWELSPFIPTVIKNKTLMICHRFLPWLCEPVCHTSDILCRKSAGLLKLEDLLPDPVMDAMDWCTEHPMTTGAICAGAAILACYSYFKKPIIKSEKTTEFSANQRSKFLAQGG